MSIFLFLAELNEKVAGTVAQAFTRLYEQYLPKVFRYVNYRINDVEMAEDITSIIFEKALTRFTTYRAEKANFSTWIFSIARNAVIDHYRSSRKIQKVPLEEAFHFSTEKENPEEEALRNEECRLLRQCLLRLSTQEQEIISLKFGAEMTNRQIARTTGLSDSNVGVILYRAVRKLRDSFNG